MMLKPDIEIVVNGFIENIPQDFTISRLIEHCREGDFHLIVEHNGRFVFPQQYSVTRLNDGDRIEFINPNLGG